MRVLLISFFITHNLGLRTIASQLMGKYDVSYLYLVDYSDKFRKARKARRYSLGDLAGFLEGFDYFLISATSFSQAATLDLIRIIRKSCPGKKIILGGSIARNDPEKCLESADAACIWEGYNILELLDYFEGRATLPVSNFRVRGINAKTAASQPLSLDEVPAPDYSIGNSYFFREGRIMKKEYGASLIEIQTSLGCVYNCSFCYISGYNKVKLANRLPLVVKGSMKKTIEKLHVILGQDSAADEVRIQDENFFCHDPNDLEYFVDEYNKKIMLPLIFDADPRSAEFRKKFEIISGLRCGATIMLGVQTGSDNLNAKSYNRHQKAETVAEQHMWMKDLIRRKKARVKISYYLMYCNPEESKDDVLQTINLMLRLRGARFWMYNLSLYPGSELTKKDGTERLEMFYDPSLRIFQRFSFYYFLYYVIMVLNNKHLDFLLPRRFKKNFLTEALNSRDLSGLYFWLIDYYNNIINRKVIRQEVALA